MTETQRRKSEAAAPGPVPTEVGEALRAAQSKQASDIVLLDLRGTGAFTDHFVICSARNRRQAKAIADAVQESLRASGGRRPIVEGYARGDWILLDCFDFVIHVFTPDMRAFYDLERLWGGAVRMAIDDPAAEVRRPPRPTRS